MGIVRQLPGLYIRGSIANITLPNLTQEQKDQINLMMQKVLNHPEMVKHKAKFIRELGVTIKGDYAEDSKCAEQEYMISVWRGVVHLFMHRSYSFICTHCGATEYTTKRGRPKSIDRIQIPCPSCRHVYTISDGHKQAINHDRISQPSNFKFTSTIIANVGSMKYDDPQKIIDCPIQLKKFFGEFIWNYFRQQIKENKRKEHKKVAHTISGPADDMIFQSLLALCKQYKLVPNFEKVFPIGGYYIIKCQPLLASPEFSIEIAELLHQAHKYNISITIEDDNISVCQKHDAEVINISIITPEHVTFLESNQDTESENSFTVEQVSYRTVRGMNIENFNNQINIKDFEDASKSIRRQLPEGDCIKVFDILSQAGDTWSDFVENYGISDPKINQIAEYLNITSRAVKNHKETIRVICLANGLQPQVTH